MPPRPAPQRPSYESLQTSLVNSRTQGSNNALFQTIKGLIEAAQQSDSVTVTEIAAAASSLAALKTLTFLTENNETVELLNSRRVLAGINISFDDTVPNIRTENVLPGFTTGSVPFFAAGSVISEDNPNLFWNNTTKRLGLKTNVPTVTFDLIESVLVAVTTISSRLHNSTVATALVPKQISPGMEFSGNAWNTGTLASNNPRIALYNKPSSDGTPFPALYFATNIGVGWVDQILFGSLNGDSGALNWRLGGGTNIIFSRSGRGISFVSDPLTDAFNSSHGIFGQLNAGENLTIFDNFTGYVYIEGNNFGTSLGTIPMMQIRGFDQSVSSPVIHIRYRSLPGGAVANGFGGRNLFQASSSTTANQDQGALDLVWSDVTHATRSADFVVNLVNSAAALAEKLRLLSTGELKLIASGILTFTGRTKIISPVDSQLLLTNNAASAFDRLMFGGTTSSFPSIKRNAATLDIQLADDSALAELHCLNLGVGITNPSRQVEISRSSNSSSSAVYPAARVINTLVTQGDGVATFNQADLQALAGNGTVDGRFLTRFDTLFSGVLFGSISNHSIGFYTNGQANIRLFVDTAGLLQFAGQTASFPALKRNSAVLETKLADDSAYAQHKALEFSASSANFLMRTSVAWTNGAAAAVGTLNNAPAAGDPTKWIPVDDNGTTRYIPAW